MKTENYTIKDSDELGYLIRKYPLFSVANFKLRIIRKLLKAKLIERSPDGYGMTIEEICEGSDYTLMAFAIFCLPEGSREIVKWLGRIKIMGVCGCPECGSYFELKEEGEHKGVEWEYWKCTYCNYAESNEPDYDIMPGGKDYDND